MPVGKGSIARAAKAATEEVNAAEAQPAAVEETIEVFVKTAVEKPVPKKTTPAKKVGKKSVSIQEEKFRAVSQIHSDLPDYLL